MKQQRKILLGLLVVFLIAAFAYLATPRDKYHVFIAHDLERDAARFTPEDSVDLAFANGLRHEAPRMLNPPAAVSPLLLYPPSEEDLARLSG